MTTYEQNAEALEKVIEDFGINPDPSFTEADTRSKIIDRILISALGWPEKGPYIRREEHVHQGYIDYTLQSSGNYLLLEAKRIGKSFNLPPTFRYEKYMTVKNLLKKQTVIHLMYDQVAKYAHERGVPFCAISNGTQWLIFSGVRVDNIHIRHSKVIVFNGLDSIKTNFLDFWNILSFECVGNDSLKRYLLEPATPIEPSFVFNTEGKMNMPYDRNPLSLTLVDLLPRYFGDLHGDPTRTEMLEKCFVLDDPVQDSFKDLDIISGDEAPSETLKAGTPILHFYTLPDVSRKLEALIDSFLVDQRTKFFQILLGRVGIGKTTFLLYFFDAYRKDLSDDHFVVYLDFRDVSDETDLEAFFQESMWRILSEHPKFRKLTSYETLQSVFSDEIGMLSRGPLSHLRKSNPVEFENQISVNLGRYFSDHQLLVKKLASYTNKKSAERFILVFDNVDQIPMKLQEKVIRFAYSKSTEYRAFMILSMWEETYYASKYTGKVLSTIRTVPMQIARQSITSVLVKRLDYLIKVIEDNKESLALLDSSICGKSTFCEFLDLILRSLLVDNKRVRMFLEAVALGNIRQALEMFHAFLTAGSLDTTKILEVMKKNREHYLVPVHEFIKSVMLGSRRFYSERTSDILNLFAVGDVERPSHFTRLRMLQWLSERRHEASPFGSGLIPIARMISHFNSIGATNHDIFSSLKKLVEKSLIEDDLRSQKLVDEAQALHITPKGRYYLNYIFRMFAYIDLVMQDTPFFNPEIYELISEDCDSTDMHIRFRRCDNFLIYLADQEDEELITIEKLGRDITWRKKFVPNMLSTFENTKQFIISKGYA